jgi:hypothetical protein
MCALLLSPGVPAGPGAPVADLQYVDPFPYAAEEAKDRWSLPCLFRVRRPKDPLAADDLRR